MWRETKPRGGGRIKPLRGCETPRAEGAGEANRYITIPAADSAERHRTPWEASLDACSALVRPDRLLRKTARTGVLAGGDTSEWNALGPVRRRSFLLEAPPASAGRGAGVERLPRRTPSGDRLRGRRCSHHRHPWPSTSGGPGGRVFGPDARVERCRGGVRPGPRRAGADVFAGPRGISAVPRRPPPRRRGFGQAPVAGVPHRGSAARSDRRAGESTNPPLRRWASDRERPP